MNLKLGKTKATYDVRDFLFADYRTKVILPTHPKTTDFSTFVGNWPMLGNDRWGDCVWAGADHEVMLWNAEAGNTISFTDSNTLSDYSAVTGFNPDNPNSDQGTNVHDALNYRVKTGTVDEVGNRHKLGAYVALELGNYDHILEALYLFSVVGIGIQVPSSAMDQFQQGKPWSVVAGSPIEGGHYIPIIGNPANDMLEVVTWGGVQKMTRSFFHKYCDEAYGLLSPEFIKNGKSVEGFDLPTLQQDLKAL